MHRVVVGLVAVAALSGCSGGSTSATQSPTGVTTHDLVVHVIAGFAPTGDGTTCKSVFASKELKLTDASGAVVGIATWPSSGARSGSTSGEINVGTCDESVTISSIKSASQFFTLDFGVGRLDYTRAELDGASWNITVSAHTGFATGEWKIVKA